MDPLLRGACVREYIPRLRRLRRLARVARIARLWIGSVCLAGTCASAPACYRTDPGPALQIVGESTRLRITDPVPARSPWFDGQRVAIRAARGEIVGLQVLHRGGGPVALGFPAAGGVRVRGYAVEAYPVLRPSTAMYGGSHGPGRYAEGLSPEPAPSTDPAYFELEIARDAAPGEVAGELTTAGRTVPVALTIAPVTLPPLPVRVWAYEDARELAWAGGDEAACIARFRSYGILLSPDVRLENWSARRARLAGDPGIHDVPVWISEQPAEAADQVRRWIQIFAGTGQVPFAIPIDEPHTHARRLQIRALADAVRAAGGGPGRFRLAVTDDPHPEYGDTIDLYISPLAAHLAGDRVARWTYNGAPPHAGSMVLDAEPPGMRTWGWIAWRWQIPIWYVWDALYWHDRYNLRGAPAPGRALDPRRDPVSFDDGDDHGNLDGALVPPGCQPTLRLAALRRGYQDLALLELAAACNRPATEQLAAQLVPRALGDAGSRPAWPADEAAWEAARQQLIELASCRPPAPAP
jgi:hypothetical protein